MISDLGSRREQDAVDGQFRNWRIVASGWMLVLVFAMLLVAVESVACRAGVTHPKAHLAGAVIPQRDPCVGPGIPSAAGVDGCEAAPVGQDLGALTIRDW
jgi:hypothetical protein